MISSSLISSKSCSIHLALEDMLICVHPALLTLSSFVGLSPLLLAPTIDILCAPSRKTKNHTFPRRLVFLLCCWTSHRPMSHHSDCLCCASYSIRLAVARSLPATSNLPPFLNTHDLGVQKSAVSRNRATSPLYIAQNVQLQHVCAPVRRPIRVKNHGACLHNHVQQASCAIMAHS